ncbi:phage tail tube protein [Escherichia coli]|uniref:phage tail tube protein n=1 Tax=Escherichia coli TaxID=562 RepID=UPI000E210061|nr:phage tail tube protein [Escherichia coli]
MAITQGSQSELSYVLETGYGVTPAEPQLKVINKASYDLNLTKATIENTNIRGDRQKYAPQHGNFSATGNIAAPLNFREYDDFFAGALCNTWINNVLKNGVTKQFATVVGTQKDIGAHRIARGMFVNQMALTAAQGANVEVTFDLIGKSLEATTTALDGTVTPPVSADNLIRSGYGSLTEDGVALADVTNFTLTVANNASLSHTLFTNESKDLSTDAITVTGEVTLYWNDITQFQKFINGTRTALNVVIGDGTNTYTISLPNVTYTANNAPVNAQGNLTVAIPFEATVDNVAGYTIQITRSA